MPVFIFGCIPNVDLSIIFKKSLKSSFYLPWNPRYEPFYVPGLPILVKVRQPVSQTQLDKKKILGIYLALQNLNKIGVDDCGWSW